MTFTLIMIGETAQQTLNGGLEFMETTTSDLVESRKAQDWKYILYHNGKLVKIQPTKQILMEEVNLIAYFHRTRQRTAA